MTTPFFAKGACLAIALSSVALAAPNDGPGCIDETARANKSFPLEREMDFVPVTPNDDLGFYVVYSSRKGEDDPQEIGNNVSIFIFPLYGNDVLIFGSGYDDPAGPDSAFYD